MATSEESSEITRPRIGSHETALCVVPPPHLCQGIDRLRANYDKTYGKWPAHINLIYPFVAIETLPEAIDLIRSKLVGFGPESRHKNIRLCLDKPNYFSHRRSNTVYITDSNENEAESFTELRSAILECFKNTEDSYQPHLTIGQSEGLDADSLEYLLAKASLLPPVQWQVEELVVLFRERLSGQDDMSSQMKVWATINLSSGTVTEAKRSRNLTKKSQKDDWSDEEETLATGTVGAEASTTPTTQPGTTYQFSADTAIWEPSLLPVTPRKDSMPNSLKISSYNVLVDSLYPPAQDRYVLLLRNLLSESALADVLVLQEVSDDFMSYLLRNDSVRRRYSFVTHGPPDQLGIGPLASLRNIVVLSRWNFSWDYIPFKRRHKGTVILKLETIGKWENSEFLPLIVAGVHLTSGLTDGSVAAKKSQLHTIINHLNRNYQDNRWILAGDFNLTTSAFTTDSALKNKSISSQTAFAASFLETMLSEARLSDSWLVARADTGDTWRPTQRPMNFDELYEGEEGATFDPGENALAAESVGKGLNNRPQRYDRILLKGENLLGVTGFNMFGFTEDSSGETSYGEMLVENAVPNYGSDHWGIRASFRTDIDPVAGQSAKIEDCRSALLQIRKGPLGLSDITAFKSCLAEFRMVPTDEELSKRKEVLELLRSVLQKSPSQDNSRSSFSIVVVQTGSYRLGVWTTASDIDCLCIGSIRAKTFFALAGHRLRKAVDLGIKILRKVKANSGTMLELEIRGVKLDLQYCPATKIAESWPEVMELPPSDPSFDLPIQSLSKLNSFRDPDYLQRTIPDLFAFRLAHRFIRAWAKQRGIFSSKFGYLGGIHITLLLSRICKLLFREAGAITAADLACTFFNYYANFDWKTQMVLDPFFHKQQPRYRRSAREPMVILGLHSPRANVAHTASLPSVRTLVEELNRADNLLSEENMTWSKVVDGVGMEGAPANQPNGVHEYLKSYNSYIKIDVHYWGLSLAKGSMLLGWLESRCVLLLVDINKKFPDIHARIWPARFTPNHTNDDDERDYQGCYLVGLAKGENAEELAKTESDRKLAQGTLQTALEKYGDQIRGNENYFDATSSWVSVTHVKQSDLGDLRLDDREWGDYVVREDDEFDTGDDEEEEEDTAVDLDDSNDATMVPPSTNKVKPPSTSKPVSSKKLRPATDILNRLRWDPSLDSSDHIVGYEDRFLGTREIGLDRWKTEQTDDEFIPQHRIVYFRRKSDGVVVWHRERRLDGVFGSGAGRGEKE